MRFAPDATVARSRTILLLSILGLALGAGTLTQAAGAEGLADEGGAEWRVEQPAPPPPPVGVEASKVPVGLGRIGDIEFYAPNRGALITAGNGSVVAPGVWLYNGERWRELSSVCGARDGRIAWAGPDEFWTISDGRPGQAEVNGKQAPLANDTLCHFAPPPGEPSGALQVVGSYASPAFLPSSYPAMHAAACITPNDCWFAGEPLESPALGAFELHWNGHSLEPEPYLPEGHAVWDMRRFEGRLYEGLRLRETCGGETTSQCDRVTRASRHPPALLAINGEGASTPFEPVLGLPLYGEGEFFPALSFLHLSASESALWAAAGPAGETPKGSESAGVTVIRREEGAASWSQLLGPQSSPSGKERFPEQALDAIAAEPGGTSAWIALDSKVDVAREEPDPKAPALLARIASDGTVSDQLTLPAAGDPSGGEPYGFKGAADRLACPAPHDCWLTTTHGWLLHLASAGERQLGRDSDPVFSGEEPIVFRPLDQGLPQVPPDAPPVDNSGLEAGQPPLEGLVRPVPPAPFATVTVPLLSGVHTRLRKGGMLELRFSLSVKAKVRLVALRRRRVVASTSTRVFPAGSHSLVLRLNVHRWPTKLDLQTHALGPLKTASTRESSASTNAVSTSLAFPATRALTGSGTLP